MQKNIEVKIIDNCAECTRFVGLEWFDSIPTKKVLEAERIEYSGEILFIISKYETMVYHNVHGCWGNQVRIV